MRGDSGVAGEGRVVGVPKFHSWGKCIMPLTNIYSDWMFNASSGLRNFRGTKFSRFSRICLRPRKILTAKFCDSRALCFVIVEPRKIFLEIFASASPRKICPAKISRHRVS